MKIMKTPSKSLYYWLVILCFNLQLVSLANQLYAEVVDKIIAKVNNEIITLSELQDRVEVIKGELFRIFQGEELENKLKTLEKDVLESMIDEILWVDQAKENGIIVTEEDVDRAVADIMTRSKLNNKDEFEQELIKQGLTITEYRNILRKQILIMRMKNTVSSGKLRVDEEEVKEYYNTHKDKFTKPESIRVRQIFLPVNKPDQEETVRILANKIVNELRNGARFCNMVKMYSIESGKYNCGDLGFFKKGEMSPELETVAFTLEPGQFSGPVQSNYGFHILRVVERKVKVLQPYEEVRDYIFQLVKEQKASQQEKKWIKNAKKTAFIEILL